MLTVQQVKEYQIQVFKDGVLFINILLGGDDLWRVFDLKGISIDEFGEHATWDLAYAEFSKKVSDQP